MSEIKPPLNQSYREKATLEARPEVGRILADYKRWAREEVRWCPHDLHRSLGKPDRIHCGRTWDAALTLASLDFTGMRVLEFGARASLLSPYLTKTAEMVTATDLFGASHRMLGDLAYWEEIWKRGAFRPERLRAGTADMRDSGYEPASFDAVICISSIEHVTTPKDGDQIAARHMGSLVKPGGFLIIGTDMAERFRVAGGFYYDEQAIWDRLIEPSGCLPYGPMDLSWEGADQSPHKSGEFDRCCCLFVLQKPEVRREE